MRLAEIPKNRELNVKRAVETPAKKKKVRNSSSSNSVRMVLILVQIIFGALITVLICVLAR